MTATPCISIIIPGPVKPEIVSKALHGNVPSRKELLANRCKASKLSLCREVMNPETGVGHEGIPI
jgi:hypothetical protein